MTMVAGLDLSLTSTGIAIAAHGNIVATHRVRSTGKASPPVATTAKRLHDLEDGIADVLQGYDLDLAVIESPSFASTNGGAHERAHLWWAVARHLTIIRCVPVGTVAPMTLKVYATGNGKADKGDVIAAVRERYASAGEVNNDEADAVILAAMGSRRLGRPMVGEGVLSAKQLKAMETAKWPA